MFFDTHAHYDDEAFDIDRDKLLRSMPENGVGLIVVPGCDVRSSLKAMELAGQYRHIYMAAGIHPEEVTAMKPDDLKTIGDIARSPKCVAIGEIGLDYYWDTTHKEEMKRLFTAQIELALSLDKPVIIHDRDAHGDCMEILRRFPGLRGVFHCYSGSAEMAKELLRSGWYLGFDGPVTYKNPRKAYETLEICPMDRLVLETDSPYLSPVPLRGKRNDSRNLGLIASRIAEIKGCSADEIAKASFDNGRRLFGIDSSLDG